MQPHEITPRQAWHPLQIHGFRSMYSCETQLLVTIQDILTTRDSNIQSDIAVLDFSKAFDKVPHQRLMDKLGLYGIDGEISSWITAFLSGRTQRVMGNNQVRLTFAQVSPRGIWSICSQGRPVPSFYRMTRSHYKLHELC